MQWQHNHSIQNFVAVLQDVYVKLLHVILSDIMSPEEAARRVDARESAAREATAAQQYREACALAASLARRSATSWHAAWPPPKARGSLPT